MPKSKSSSSNTPTSSASSSAPTNQQDQSTLVSLYDIDDTSAHHCGYCNQNGNISIGRYLKIYFILSVVI